MEKEVQQNLKDTENALRDFIATALKDFFGDDWISKCGVTLERTKHWRDRKEIEQKKQSAGTTEERLLYYADFYDIQTIIRKNWANIFSKVFFSGDLKKMEVYLSIMENFRDIDAHRRELLSYQKYLILGIVGEIRSSIIKYRSKKETSEDCFPRIESVRDSLGNIWTPESKKLKELYNTNKILHPGDEIEFVITASDPEDCPLDFGISIHNLNIKWQKENIFLIKIEKEHISSQFLIGLYIKSLREYHANIGHDDYSRFTYTVLPNK